MGKPAPGPWHLEPNGAPYNIVGATGEKMLLARYMPMEQETFEASARLVAAAPELRSALAIAVTALEHVHDGQRDRDELLYAITRGNKLIAGLDG